MPRRYISFEESVRIIAKKHEVTPKMVKYVLKCYFNVLKMRIAEGFICKIRRFGTLSLNRKGKAMLRRSLKVKEMVKKSKYKHYNRKREYLKK